MLRCFPAVAVVGARHTSKATLVRSQIPDYTYVSLDVPSEAKAAENGPASFFARHPEPVIIDEVQYAPNLFRHLKVRIDLDRHGMGRFVLAGSQEFDLMKSLSENLAGRVAFVSLMIGKVIFERRPETAIEGEI
ncbi:MAG: AAA family ATPase [Alkalispirochaeta sp.]